MFVVFVMNLLSRASVIKKTKMLKSFKFRTFAGRFQVTVKGLTVIRGSEQERKVPTLTFTVLTFFSSVTLTYIT